MEPVENLLENARFLSRTGQLKALDYERFKMQLSQMQLTEVQYQNAVRRLCEAMNL